MNRVVIEIEEGLVSSIYADEPGELRVVVVDHDTQGANRDELTRIRYPNGDIESFLREHDVTGGGEDLCAVYDAQERNARAFTSDSVSMVARNHRD